VTGVSKEAGAPTARRLDRRLRRASHVGAVGETKTTSHDCALECQMSSQLTKIIFGN
jgi:hypothetical protein